MIKQNMIYTLTVLLILLSIFSVFPTESAARDWFVRPYGGDYGKKDGATYLDSWNGLDQVVWGATGVKAGDTLWICGLHDAPTHNKLVIKASGTSDAARIEIRGDYPTDPGTIWNTAIKYEGTANWVPAGFGSYKRSQWGSSTRLVENGTLFAIPVSNPPDANWQPGNTYWDSINNILYYRPYSNLTSNTKIYVLSGSGAVLIENASYIKLRNILIRGNTDYLGAVTISGSSYITLDGVDVMHSFHGISVLNNSDYGIIKNSKISKCGNGIYLMSANNISNNDNWLFDNNDISDITKTVFSVAPDQHGIGIQGGVGHLVVRNKFRNSATGVTLYCGDGQVGSIEITRNYATAIYTLPSTGSGPTYGHGFAYDYHGTWKAGVVEVKIHHNVADTCENGAIRCALATRAEIFNNTINNCGIGIFIQGNPPLGIVKNNIITRSKKQFIYLVDSGAINTFNLDINNNLYYPVMADQKQFYYGMYKTSGFYTYLNWIEIFPGYEKASLTNDPLFFKSEPLKAEDFRLTSSSPAIGAGEKINGIFEDYAGSHNNFRGTDIGAFEYIGILLAPTNLRKVAP